MKGRSRRRRGRNWEKEEGKRGGGGEGIRETDEIE